MKFLTNHRQVPDILDLHLLFGECDLIAKIMSIEGAINTKALTGTRF